LRSFACVFARLNLALFVDWQAAGAGHRSLLCCVSKTPRAHLLQLAPPQQHQSLRRLLFALSMLCCLLAMALHDFLRKECVLWPEAE